MSVYILIEDAATYFWFCLWVNILIENTTYFWLERQAEWCTRLSLTKRMSFNNLTTYAQCQNCINTEKRKLLNARVVMSACAAQVINNESETWGV